MNARRRKYRNGGTAGGNDNVKLVELHALDRLIVGAGADPLDAEFYPLASAWRLDRTCACQSVTTWSNSWARSALRFRIGLDWSR